MARHPDRSLVQAWLDGYAAKTRGAYDVDWTAFFKELGRKRLGAVTQEDVELFLDKAETPSIRRRLGVIKTFYNHALSQGLLAANPAMPVRNPKASWQPRAYRSVDERAVLDMLNTADKVRDKVLLGLVYTCALTADEALGLTWSDVDRADGTLDVPGKHARRLAYPASVAPDLAALGTGRSNNDPVLESRRGAMLSKRQLNRILGDLGEAVGVREVTVGRLRNAYAQHALARGIPMDEVHHRLGNRSYNSTASQYRAVAAARKIKPGRGRGHLLEVPAVSDAGVVLRDEDFIVEAAELAELDAIGEPGPARRKRRDFLRRRLAYQLDRRRREGGKLPPGHGRIPRNVPLDGEDIGILLDLVDEAGTVLAMRAARAGHGDRRVSHEREIGRLKELRDLLDRHMPPAEPGGAVGGRDDARTGRERGAGTVMASPAPAAAWAGGTGRR